MQSKLQTLMNEEMTRKDFLLRLAGIVLIITGITGMAQKLRGTQAQSNGYGASAYGGNSRTR
jgi:hypothetical protein